MMRYLNVRSYVWVRVRDTLLAFMFVTFTRYRNKLGHSIVMHIYIYLKQHYVFWPTLFKIFQDHMYRELFRVDLSLSCH